MIVLLCSKFRVLYTTGYVRFAFVLIRQITSQILYYL